MEAFARTMADAANFADASAAPKAAAASLAPPTAYIPKPNAQHAAPSPQPFELSGQDDGFVAISTLRYGDLVRVVWGESVTHDGTVIEVETKLKGSDLRPITVYRARVQYDDGSRAWVDDEQSGEWEVRLLKASEAAEAPAQSAKRAREKPQTFATYTVEDGSPRKPLKQRKTTWDEDDDFEVETVLEYRASDDHYLVKWKDWDASYNSWEPAGHLLTEDLRREAALVKAAAAGAADDLEMAEPPSEVVKEADGLTLHLSPGTRQAISAYSGTPAAAAATSKRNAEASSWATTKRPSRRRSRTRVT